MNQTRNIKIDIIANMQSQLNKKVKEWCMVDSKFIEKRSVPKGDSKIFADDTGTLAINKCQIQLSLFCGYSDADLLKNKSLIIKSTTEDLMTHIVQYCTNYSRQVVVDNGRPLLEKEIKFIFYGLMYIDENTVQLEYGVSNMNKLEV